MNVTGNVFKSYTFNFMDEITLYCIDCLYMYYFWVWLCEIIQWPTNDLSKTSCPFHF
jgi:hypothetical protein